MSVSGFAQKQKTSPLSDPDKTASNQTSRDKSGKILLQSGASLEAQLQSTLDAKNAKVGDEVVLKTTKAIKQNGETIIPKGSNLIGRVTEVQKTEKNNKSSRIAMIFDRIEGKNLAAPISARIVSILNTGARTNVADTIDSDVSGSSDISGSSSSTNRRGGGLLGGVTGTVGGVVNSTTSTVGGVTNTAGQTVGGATQTLGRTVNGIQISNSVSGSAQSSSTLSAQDKNLRLEKGATFQLQLTNTLEN